jgi:hypothetical protein
MLSFLLANREDMQKQDMDVVRSLGLKFRGRNAWPLFRSQEPGYAPWFLNTKEANFLTVIIDRALAVSEKVRINNLDLFEEVDDDKVYTCFYRYNQWKEEWRKPEISHDNPLSLERDLNPVNEAELLLLSNKAGKPSGAWELDLFMIPAPIGPPGSRPYFPLCFMAVEKKQGLIIGNQMTEPWITIAEKRDVIIQMIGKIGLIPRSIFVRSPQVEKILAPIAKTLGVNLQVGPLPLLEEARDSMQNYFSGKV